jgi:ArsR family transcriptional regulator, lead/cadmium/zinc/bismuth-responsive transcriptional repressor
VTWVKAPTDEEIKAAAARAKALSDPTRLRVALAISELPGELIERIAEEIGRHQSLVSRHAQVLYEAGLVDRLAKWKPHYVLNSYGEELIGQVVSSPHDYS